ncbi:branched-chain amino acid aminotransferase [Luteipulveratus sp. YIM 133132]|uniref:branched-chain amino acid aminotransferase n=1 Tax=Luteipulveratus flavus TaxID=3031728 RepID=UPI0023B01E71|nr:branched-chain amino acid aminotransferase [Luteipulveratus sp. YIM 133132]MDE9366331.1 branched-chain amino acid aminotransferase [Luteipulveratus sp. YIM 133132]
MSTSSTLSFTVTERPDRASEADRAAVLANPGFGQRFTDHMVLATWRKGEGWGDARVTAYGPLQLEPSAAVLHYAQEIFEGMKAYRHADGSVWTFRPEANAARFARSAHRLALPAMEEADFLGSLRALVETDIDWVPDATTGESSLYLRPFMFASEAFLGVRPANEVTYCLIASPAGSYFASGLKPVSLWISEHYSRAGVGGTGAAKCGGNYAASLAAQIEAAEHGCDQSVFLDSLEQKYIEELGGMNVFLVYSDGRLVTPELSGSILEGVTRSSILELAKDLDLEPEERRISLEEWRAGAESGEITEAFACGTAAVVTPVGRLVWNGGEVRTGPQGEGGEVATKIREALLDIQTGRTEDTRGWLTRLA